MSQEAAPYAVTDPADLDEPERWEKGMAEIADLLADELRQAGEAMKAPFLPTDARALAARLAARLFTCLGGSIWYIPKGANLERARRDLEISSAHDGTRAGPNGTEALCRRYRLSEVHIYRILERQRRMERQRRQADLFAKDEEGRL